MIKKRCLKILLAVPAVILFITGAGRASTNNFLVSPNAPSTAASAMFTLEDIYSKLDVQGTTVNKRAGAFTEPSGEPTNGTMHTLDDVMALLTNRSPVAKSGQVTSYNSGDDGNLQKGVAWPSPRFVTNNIPAAGTNVVTDKLTGLMWVRDASLAGQKTWADAITYCNDLTYAGYSDWRLPNVNEMLSLCDWSRLMPPIQAGHPFKGVQTGDGVTSAYWLSTVAASSPSANAWYLTMRVGTKNVATKTSSYYVWPVRSGP